MPACFAEPSTKLQLEAIELLEIEMPLKSAFETSFGRFSKRRVVIVRAIDKSGAAGYGECTAMEQPLYNHESVDSAWPVITGSIVPILSDANISCAEDVGRALAPIRGNRMAIAAVETAVWDLESRIAGKPLWSHLGGTIEEIECGVSIGIQSSPEVLVERVATEIAAGYRRIKIKIKPGKDIRLVEAVRREFPDILLSVDANSAYELEASNGLWRELDQFGLLMIEQPLAAGDLLDHAKLQLMIDTPICLDESITSVRDARQAIELEACRIINIKLGRVGGHAAAREIQYLAAEKNIPVWCGGMLETGIGRAQNIAMSTLPGFTLPGDVSASERYWAEDIVDPPIIVSPAGTIRVPDSAGIGFAVRNDVLKARSARTETVLL
ncbi:MAG: o-succinylbenzoate synthase [Pyrinomonadaceae bacterium]